MITISQTPADVNLSQSPMVVSATTDSGSSNTGFQYVCNLYIWDGAINASGSAAYQLVKYPNDASYGIFEFSRIVNSTMTDLAEINHSNVKYVKADILYRYLNANGVYVYDSGSTVSTAAYKALDGYAIFQEAIGSAINTKTTHWPIMSDGPATQSVFLENTSTLAIYTGTTDSTSPTSVRYVSNLGVSASVAVSSSTNTNNQIQQVPMCPSSPGFPLSTTGLTSYTIQAYNSTTPLEDSIKFEIDCVQKYPNVRVKWKNRFGQFDYLNFDMVSRQSFQTEKHTYQPQIGTWNSSQLQYAKSDTAIQNYIADSKQAISVNSNWLQQEWNDILKQLLVSDEMYWVYDEVNNYVRPITVTTSNVQFKTGVNDHVIQYQLDFAYGQGYKLII
jgi:hypothetical protein